MMKSAVSALIAIILSAVGMAAADKFHFSSSLSDTDEDESFAGGNIKGGGA